MKLIASRTLFGECGKKAYLTRKEAKKVLKKVALRNHWNNKNGDVYYCKTCSGHHITSKNTCASRIFKKQNY